MFKPATPHSQAERFLRSSEQTLLDPLHTKLPLWSFPHDIAAFACMTLFDANAAFDDGLLLPAAIRAPRSPHNEHDRKDDEEGYSQAMKWLSASPPSQLPTSVPVHAIPSAKQFLHHARIYYLLSSLHTCFSRGMISAEVDIDGRCIKFSQLDTNGRSFDLDFGVELAMRSSHQPTTIEINTIRNHLYNFKNIGPLSYDVSGGLIQLSDTGWSFLCGKKRPMYPINDLVDLDPKFQFKFFTLEEFDAFWNAVATWSTAAISVLSSESLVGQFPRVTTTQCVSRDLFVNRIRQMTSLNVPQIQQIIKIAELGGTMGAIDPFLQPFLATPTQLAWSPFSVLSSRHRRNLLRLISRDKEYGSNSVANILGACEKKSLARLGAHLSDCGMHFSLNKELKVGSDKTEVDLLAWTRNRPNEILIIQHRNKLPPNDPSEVHALTDYAISAQRQVRKSILLLSRMPLQQLQNLFPFVPWNSITPVYYGLVTILEGSPDDRYDATEIPIADLHQIATLGKMHMACPSSVTSACRSRAWLPASLPKHAGEIVIEIEDVKYILPAVEYPGE